MEYREISPSEYADLAARILYEDNHLLVVNKRAGEIVQGDKTGDEPLAETYGQYRRALETIKDSEELLSGESDSDMIEMLKEELSTSKEKVEEYFRMPLPRLREKLNEVYSDQYCIQQVQNDLTKNVKATPADVRKFFNSLPKDSLPYIPMQVEAQIITINPVIPQQEIDEVKSRLRDYAQQVSSGVREFSTLAILYSEDQSTAVVSITSSSAAPMPFRRILILANVSGLLPPGVKASVFENIRTTPVKHSSNSSSVTVICPRAGSFSHTLLPRMPSTTT